MLANGETTFKMDEEKKHGPTEASMKESSSMDLKKVMEFIDGKTVPSMTANGNAVKFKVR